MELLFKKIVECIPSPKGDFNDSFSMLVSLLKFNSFFGRLAVGKINTGKIKINQDIAITSDGKNFKNSRISKIYKFMSNDIVPTDEAKAGEVVALAGVEDVVLGETITDINNPKLIVAPSIDPPTISMNFLPNDSPFAGKEGSFVNSRQLKERLDKEILSDVALKYEELYSEPGFKVSGRGELHLSVLIEKMRREGYEFSVTMPKVIFKEENNKKLEPYEELTIDLQEETMGKVIEALGNRKGTMISMNKESDLVRLMYKIPTRGFFGFRSDFMTLTKGMGTISSIFLDYEEFAGEVKVRENGVLIAMESGTTTAYSLANLESRGELILGAGEKIYEGEIIGINSRKDDMVVNPCKGKKLSNMRASGSDDAIVLTPHKVMSLEECLTFIADDELVEVTPKSIRLRKRILNEIDRKKFIRK